MLIGGLAQLALLLALAKMVTGWTTLLVVGIATWTLFYIVRAIAGALSPEERELLARARRRLPSIGS